MTPESEQLEAQSREAVIAQINDPNVKIEYCHKEKETWHTKDSYPAFDLNSYHYRIAKPKKWYRVGEDVNGGIMLVRNNFQESRAENQPEFKRWLPEGRKYYD